MRDKLAALIVTRPVLMFGLGGIVAGLLSYLALKFGPQLRFSVLLESRHATSIVPGLIFGALIAACNFKFGLREKFSLASIVVLTGIAWILAHDCTMRSHDYLSTFHRVVQVEPADPANPAVPADPANPAVPADPQDLDRAVEQTENLPFILVVAGMVGGLVGGLGTMFAIALVNPRFRYSPGLLPIVVAATLLGSLVELMSWGYGDLPIITLFVCWQAAVSALIARALIAGARGEAH